METRKSSRKSALRSSAAETFERCAGEMADLLHRTLGSKEEAKHRGADAALSLLALQRKAFDKGIEMIASLQEYSEETIGRGLKHADWMPHEGKEVARMWSRLLNDGRSEFKRSVDKSYDLMTGYFERVRAEEPEPAKRPASKKTATKKTAAKKKPAAKKKATAKKKPAPRKSAAT